VTCGLAADFSAAAPDTNGAEATGAMEDSISAPAVAMPIVRLLRVDVLTAVLLLVKMACKYNARLAGAFQGRKGTGWRPYPDSVCVEKVTVRKNSAPSSVQMF
jgi:hypothetical protein